jgi:hypothetical protein
MRLAMVLLMKEKCKAMKENERLSPMSLLAFVALANRLEHQGRSNTPMLNWPDDC